jgi:hypothetical protein
VNLCEEKDEVYHCGKAFSLLKPQLPQVEGHELARARAV